jgi:hypothetical protein
MPCIALVKMRNADRYRPQDRAITDNPGKGKNHCRPFEKILLKAASSYTTLSAPNRKILQPHRPHQFWIVHIATIENKRVL